MNIRHVLSTSVSVSALCVGGAAVAQDFNFYLGAGAEIGSGQVELMAGEAALRSLSVIGGVRLPTPSGVFFGAEVDTALYSEYSLGGGGAPMNNVTRLRGQVGYDFGMGKVFAAAGKVWVNGALDGVPISGTTHGETYGIGVEYDVNDRVGVRLEVMRDSAPSYANGYEWDQTSIRAAALVNF